METETTPVLGGCSRTPSGWQAQAAHRAFYSMPTPFGPDGPPADKLRSIGTLLQSTFNSYVIV